MLRLKSTSVEGVSSAVLSNKRAQKENQQNLYFNYFRKQKEREKSRKNFPRCLPYSPHIHNIL
jgi:hypothetical protein